MPASTSAAARGPSIPAVLLGGLAVFLGLAGYLHVQQRAIVDGPVAERSPGTRPPPQLADVGQAVRAMQLVTVTLDTTVTVNARDESWLGNVDATIRVPVRLFYGTDFSGARVEPVRVRPLVNAFIVSLPEPARVATEVYPELEQSELQTGWLRFRAIAGEHALGLARRSLGEESRRMVLRPEDAEMVREQTRRRVCELVRAIAGDEATVTVLFEERAAPTPAPLVHAGKAGDTAASKEGGQ